MDQANSGDSWPAAQHLLSHVVQAFSGWIRVRLVLEFCHSWSAYRVVTGCSMKHDNSTTLWNGCPIFKRNFVDFGGDEVDEDCIGLESIALLFHIICIIPRDNQVVPHATVRTVDDYDDSEEFFDVPDLNSRTWRHPSEVAASVAAAAPPLEDVESGSTSRRPRHLVGAVVAAAMCTTGLVAGDILKPGTILEASAPQVNSVTYLASDNPSAPYQPDGNDDTAATGLVSSLLVDFGEPEAQVAGHIVVDGMIVTSASKLAGHSSLTLRIGPDLTANGEDTLERQVEVLRVAPEYDLAIIALPAEVPSTLSQWSTENEGAANLEEIVAVYDCSNRTTIGRVTFTDMTTPSSDGSELDGLTQTDIPTTDCAVGSVVQNAKRELAGMVVNTPTSEALFVPTSIISEQLSLART